MKILLSWYAYNNDFIQDPGIQVNPEGPTASFHQHFFADKGYEKHILLTSQKDVMEDRRLLLLRTYLSQRFPEHEVETLAIGVSDIIDLRQIMGKVDSLLESLSDYHIDIFISPGTPAMQTAWTLMHLTKHLNTTLIQTRAARDTKEKIPQISYVQIERDTLASTASIREVKSDVVEVSEDYLYTKSIEQLYARAIKVAATDKATVLIMGPSGSGKEHLARFIHDHSLRKESPYVAVNCSAFSDELLRSELFGHQKGAFTGAHQDKTGLIQEAEGGTVFLDEIGDVSPFMQQSLLRVLQQGEIMPVGSSQSSKVNTRFIAATNADLIAKCEAGAFRWDLFYRLAVVELEVPSLFERGKDEVNEYLEYFIKQKAKKFRSSPLKLSKDLKKHLLAYSYPGNLRELENIIERLYVFAEESKAKTSDLPARVLHPSLENSILWKDIEKSHIEKILRKNNYNQNRTCEDIGYGSINTLRNKIAEYGIQIIK